MSPVLSVISIVIISKIIIIIVIVSAGKVFGEAMSQKGGPPW
jgi:hypothetical protein